MSTRYGGLFALVLLAVLLPLRAQPKGQAEFSDAVAESLLRQFSRGLIAGNADTVLATFDADRTSGYGAFADQLRSFLNKWDNIRVHYQIAQVEKAGCGNETCGNAQVQFEMEAEDVQSQLPPMRRNAQLQLQFKRGDKGWKIVSLSPRELFR